MSMNPFKAIPDIQTVWVRRLCIILTTLTLTPVLFAVIWTFILLQSMVEAIILLRSEIIMWWVATKALWAKDYEVGTLWYSHPMDD